MAEGEIKGIKEDLQLGRLVDTKLSPNEIIFRQNLRVDYLGSTDLTDKRNYNRFVSALRTYQADLSARLEEGEKIYLYGVLDEIKKEHNILNKIERQFRRLDFLHFVRDNRVAALYYATMEGGSPGALTQFISKRLNEKDSNYILGIFGVPRSGKSLAGGRLGVNISTLTGSDITIADVVYTYRDWLQVKDDRRKLGTLKGSVQIIDEGGNVADAQNWWDKEVKKIVRHLRTQGFDNTCTIIISPMYTDIVSRARGLFHAVMIPWKEWGKQYMELTDTSNIDFEKKISSWKIDLMDTDPMTGKTYRGKLKAALGEIVKVDVVIPKKDWIKPYLKKSIAYKEKLQAEQLIEERQDQVKRGDTREIEEEIIADIDNYTKQYGKRKLVDWYMIKKKYKVSRDTAIQIKKIIERRING